jgi:asparagine synthase (glutamine-hydrolysing)
MCGICGFTWRDEPRVREMAHLLRHRGPDHVGVLISDQVSLGHTRLSVQDLSALAHQPMSDEAGRVHLVFNGEIYNFQELRKELEGLGHTFRSTSDTEVLLRAYLAWGEDCFRRFNGMWAVALHDVARGTLLLSRDRLGKKPLYYATVGGRLVFASELKSVLLHVDEPRLDPVAVDMLLSSQFVPSPRTMFQGVHKVEPRQLLRYSLATGALEKSYYYSLPEYRPVHDRDALVREGQALLEDAVRLRMVADVRVGAFLSGGLDSSTIVALMKKLGPEQAIETICVGFDFPGADESPHAAHVAAELGTQHHNLRFGEADIEATMARALESYDDPVADPASLPMYRLCEETRRRMTVALSGDGGDEVFGGYDARRVVAQMVLIKRVPAIARRLLLRVLRPFAGEEPNALAKLVEALRVSLLPAEEYFAELGATFVYRPESWKRWARERLRETLKSSGGDLVEAMLQFDLFFNRLGDNYCAKVDRMSMAHGLEVRSPFLDYRFAELAARIPVRWKVTARRTKVLMRDVIRPHVPPAVLERKKQGFGSPLGAWVERHPGLLSEGLDRLFEAQVISRAWFDFYREKVLVRSNPLHHEYKKRLYVLIRWFERWGGGATNPR